MLSGDAAANEMAFGGLLLCVPSLQAEVTYLGELQHPNLVRLIGCCSDGTHRLLVYEFMEYGSLERFLFRRE